MILSLIDISGCFFIMFRFERNVRIKPERRINSDYPVKPGNDTEKGHELYGYQSNGGGRTTSEEREGKTRD